MTENVQEKAAQLVSRHAVTGARLGSIARTMPEEAEAIIKRAREAQPGWAELPLDTRMSVIRRMRDLIFERHAELLDLMVKELGKIPHEARFELLQPLAGINYQLRIVKRVLKPRRIFIWQFAHRTHMVLRKPHGVVMIISPWNFPVVLGLDAIIPALLAGNGVIYKPSEHTPLIAEFLANAAYDAGVPHNVFQVVHGYAETASAVIDQRPDKIHFTGSVETGRRIALKAAEMLVPVTLELGGKDCAIVLEDADIERTARGIIWASMMHAGQMCAGVERVYVLQSVADKLIGAMRQVVKRHVKAGTPDMPDATYGTITLEKQVGIIDEHICEAEQNGARIFRDAPLDISLERVKGSYREPVIIVDAPEGSRVLTEETFGPVIAVTTVRSVKEAVTLANRTEYGLTASVWTRDKKRGEQIALKLEVGAVSINDHLMSASAPHLPWGGVKHSGYGRTRGEEGLRSMTVPMSYSADRIPFSLTLFSYPYTTIKKTIVKRLVYLWYGPTWKDRLQAFKVGELP